MYTLATLYQLRQRLGLAISDTADDPRLLSALQTASAQIERLAGRRFCPRLATLQHSIARKAPGELLLDDDLLQLTSLTNGDGSSIALSDVITLPAGDSAFAILRLINGATFVWNSTPLRAISVTGIWGWHDVWSQAWRDSADTVQNNPLSSSATSLTVIDADGADNFNETPRFQVGQLICIDSEYLRVLAVNTSTNVLTVLRGVAGTTAASHTQSTAISIYHPPADVETLCLRWAAWLYKEPDNRALPNKFGLATPADLLVALEPLRRVAVKA
jgi:hypothetical protein